MNNTKKFYAIIGGILLLVVGLYYFGVFEKAEDFIKVGFYDNNGNPIKVSSLSVVENVPGVSFIDLTVTAINKGEIPLTCAIISALPTPFDNAISKDFKIVPSSTPSKASWTSDLISVEQFESISQPVRFSATIRCKYKSGLETVFLNDKTGSIDLNIESDIVNADFDVGIDTGGTSNEFCGDEFCQSVSEDAISCPQDCAVYQSVKFRTSDLSYVSGSAIAYSGICGEELVAYGYGSPNPSSVGGAIKCEENNYYLKNLLVDKIPVVDGFYYGRTDGVLSLYSSNKNPDDVYICANSKDMSKIYLWRYSKTDSDASKIDTTPFNFDSSKEVLC